MCIQGWDVAQLVESLIRVQKVLVPFPGPHLPGMLVQSGNPSTQGAEAERERVQGHLQLYNEVKAGLGYMRSVSQHFLTDEHTVICCLFFFESTLGHQKHLNDATRDVCRTTKSISLI